MSTAREINWAMLDNFDHSLKDSDKEQWCAAFNNHAAKQTHIPKPRLAQMSEEFLSVFSSIRSPPADAPWTLRNLATKEFVRCPPTVDYRGGRGHVDHPEGKWLHLSKILTMRICYSRTCTPGHYPMLNTFGQWAGDSFDIVPLDKTRGTLGEAWTDVTDAIVDEAQKYFESHCRAMTNKT